MPQRLPRGDIDLYVGAIALSLLPSCCADPQLSVYAEHLQYSALASAPTQNDHRPRVDPHLDAGRVQHPDTRQTHYSSQGIQPPVQPSYRRTNTDAERGVTSSYDTHFIDPPFARYPGQNPPSNSGGAPNQVTGKSELD